LKDEIKEDELIKSNRKFFNYLINLRNRDLRKEIENCNWNAILQLIRYCEYEITNLQEEKEDYKSRCEKAIKYIKNNCYYLVDNDDKNLLNILNGGDEE
jgi:hypothetical protein